MVSTALSAARYSVSRAGPTTGACADCVVGRPLDRRSLGETGWPPTGTAMRVGDLGCVGRIWLCARRVGRQAGPTTKPRGRSLVLDLRIANPLFRRVMFFEFLAESAYMSVQVHDPWGGRLLGVYRDTHPHWVVDCGCYAVTLRCHGSLPKAVRRQLREIGTALESVEPASDEAEVYRRRQNGRITWSGIRSRQACASARRITRTENSEELDAMPLIFQENLPLRVLPYPRLRSRRGFCSLPGGTWRRGRRAE